MRSFLIKLCFFFVSSVGAEGDLRPEAEAVRWTVDHNLTERRHNNQDEDGHDLHKESKTSLQRQSLSTAESKIAFLIIFSPTVPQRLPLAVNVCITTPAELQENLHLLVAPSFLALDNASGH